MAAHSHSLSRSCSSVIAALFLVALVGCGGSSSTPPPAGNTSVTLLATSTANDKLSAFSLSFASLTLTSQSGTTVTVFSSEQGGEEFLHLNGPIEPLLTTSIPPGTYTGANLTLNGGQAFCAGVSGSPATLGVNSLASFANSAPVTVNLPQPIAISGSAAQLLLNLQVTSSVQPLQLCAPGVADQVQPMTPVFTLTQMSSSNASSAQTVLYGLKGVIHSTTSSGFQVAGNFLIGVGVSSPSWQVTTNSAMQYQGISGSSALASGTAVDFDATTQPDGTLLATRIAVYDASTSSTSITLGPVLYPMTAQSITPALLTESSPVVLYGSAFSYASPTAFAISSQLGNVAQLPFQARFDAAHLVGGQNVMTILHLSAVPTGNVPVSTLVLIPQTLDGVVTATSTAGAFTTYTITLAPYDIFPDVASLPGSNSNSLQSPSTVVVYADASTRMQTSAAIAIGSTYRFNGLVFDDNGTLRMDSDAIDDGVAQ